MEDISAKKRAIEAKLEEEKQNIAWLRESLKKSDQLGNGMINILTSFEDRLHKLEDTILPVHKETVELQRRQDNVDKTLILLDEVLAYHNVSRTMTANGTIEQGPTGHLDDYLQCMEKIQDAIDFFNRTNPDSIEVSLLGSLNESGIDMLEKEFRTLLKRHSKVVPAVTIHDILNTSIEEDDISQLSLDDAQIEHFAERIMEELGLIAVWLVHHGKSTDFMSVYSQIRSSMLLQSLQGIKESNFISLPVDFSRTYSVAGVAPKRKTMKRDMKRSSKQYNEAHSHRKQLSYSGVGADMLHKEEDENKEVVKFITTSAALLKLIQSELTLLMAIIPEEHQVPIFSQLLLETLNAYASDAEALCSAARKLFGKLGHSAIQIVLPVLKYLLAKKVDFESALKAVNAEARKKFFDVITLITKTVMQWTWTECLILKDEGQRALNEFAEKIREAEKGVNMPRDGTVHEITSNVMVFFEDVLKFKNTVVVMLISQDGRPMPESVDSVSTKRVAEYVSKTLSLLSSTLSLNSRSYDNPTLQSIFLLNNNNYILKSLQKTDLMVLIEESSNIDLEKEYQDVIANEMQNYERSWSKVIGNLLEMNNPLSTEKLSEAIEKGHLKDKHRQAIKDKFKGFNTDFEEQQQLHRTYAVPDAAQRTAMCDKILDLVIPLYKTFLLRYRDVHFTKYPEKYVKYSVEDCHRIILAMFNTPQQ